MAPRGSPRNVRYQLRGFRLHDRTNTRPSTTTAQMRVKRWGRAPARMPRAGPSRMAARMSPANLRLVFMPAPPPVQPSTDAFNRARAWSHCRETRSRRRRASCNGPGSSSQRSSRPWRVPRARPAPASTYRCFVTACRVTVVPVVRRAMDRGPSEPRRATSRRRVSAPRAAKTCAEPSRACARALARLANRLFDGLHLCGPTLVVHAIGLGAPRGRDPIEAGLHDREQGAGRDLLELEHDEGGRLGGIVYPGLHRVRMPAPGEHPRGLHALDGDVPRQVLVAPVGDLPLHAGPRGEGAGQVDAEPLAELLRIRERAPHPRAGCAQQELLFDAIGGARAHMQPPGCILGGPRHKCNLKVADGRAQARLARRVHAAPVQTRPWTGPSGVRPVRVPVGGGCAPFRDVACSARPVGDGHGPGEGIPDPRRHDDAGPSLRLRLLHHGPAQPAAAPGGGLLRPVRNRDQPRLGRALRAAARRQGQPVPDRQLQLLAEPRPRAIRRERVAAVVRGSQRGAVRGRPGVQDPAQVPAGPDRGGPGHELGVPRRDRGRILWPAGPPTRSSLRGGRRPVVRLQLTRTFRREGCPPGCRQGGTLVSVPQDGQDGADLDFRFSFVYGLRTAEGGPMSNLEFCIARRKSELPAFVRVLKALPQGRLDYRPDPKARTAAELAWVLAMEEEALLGLLDKGMVEWKDTKPPGRIDEIVAAFERSAAGVNERLSRLDEAGWQKKARLMMTGGAAWEDTIAKMAWGFLFDAVHHRGQLSTYLRPMGGKVPSIYGPSADDSGG